MAEGLSAPRRSDGAREGIQLRMQQRTVFPSQPQERRQAAGNEINSLTSPGSLLHGDIVLYCDRRRADCRLNENISQPIYRRVHEAPHGSPARCLAECMPDEEVVFEFADEIFPDS